MTDRPINSSTPDAHDASAKMAQQVDIVSRLKLKDPAQSVIFASDNPAEAQHNREVEAMLSKFSVSDPMAFDHTVHQLNDRAQAQHLPFNKETLDKFSHDQSLSVGERTVAQLMHDDYRGYMLAGRHSLGYGLIGGIVPTSMMDIKPEGIKEIDNEARLLEASKRHSELHDPKVLASVSDKLFGRIDPDNKDTLYYGDLTQIMYSDKVTEQERAAANLLASNYDTMTKLNPNSFYITRETVDDYLAHVGQPAAVNPDCTNQDASVVGNAATAALLAAGISAAMGSKRPGRAALLAGAATASITAVHNVGAEAACQHSNELLK